MIEKIKQILSNDIRPWKLISDLNNHYIVEGNFQDTKTSLEAKLTLDFDFQHQRIHFLFVENASEITTKITFQVLTDLLKSMYGTPEINSAKLFGLINSTLDKIIKELHYGLEIKNSKEPAKTYQEICEINLWEVLKPIEE